MKQEDKILLGWEILHINKKSKFSEIQILENQLSPLTCFLLLIFQKAQLNYEVLKSKGERIPPKLSHHLSASQFYRQTHKHSQLGVLLQLLFSHLGRWWCSQIHTFQKLFPFARSTQRSQGKNHTFSFFIQPNIYIYIIYLGLLWWYLSVRI